MKEKEVTIIIIAVIAAVIAYFLFFKKEEGVPSLLPGEEGKVNGIAAIYW